MRYKFNDSVSAGFIITPQNKSCIFIFQRLQTTIQNKIDTKKKKKKSSWKFQMTP